MSRDFVLHLPMRRRALLLHFRMDLCSSNRTAKRINNLSNRLLDYKHFYFIWIQIPFAFSMEPISEINILSKLLYPNVPCLNKGRLDFVKIKF